jgi:hypothetical protein
MAPHSTTPLSYLFHLDESLGAAVTFALLLEIFVLLVGQNELSRISDCTSATAGRGAAFLSSYAVAHNEVRQWNE